MNLLRLVAVWAALCVSLPAFAFGTLEVSVEDAEGLEILGASLTLTLDGSTVSHEGYSGPRGKALFEELAPGTYTLVAKHPRYQSRRYTSIGIQDGKRFEVVVALNIESTSRSTTLTKDFLTRVPSGRNYQSATQMAAGVRVGSGGNPNIGGAASNENASYPPNVNPTVTLTTDHLSTFAADVDTASYTVSRRALLSGGIPHPSSVRTEEFVNYFDYDYASPTGSAPIAANLELVPSPFDSEETLLRIGVQGKTLDEDRRPPMRLTFLVDVSGSMASQDKLGWAQTALHRLVDRLGPEDMVAMGTYAGRTQKVLPPTYTTRRADIHRAIDKLSSGGSTAMRDGIGMAYRMASEMYVDGAENRVIVLSDGDANVGPASHEEILHSIRGFAGKGITLSTVGFGTGNYRDSLMEQLANDGDGNSSYIDSEAEIDRVFGERFDSTLRTLARDVKFQVDFNPDVVTQYRLLGYENRALADEDFRVDAVDAGEVGSGHQVTAVYSLRLASEPVGKVATVHIRGKAPGKDVAAREWAFPIRASALVPLSDATSDTQLAVGVAAFAEKLRGTQYGQDVPWSEVHRIIGRNMNPEDPAERELLELVKRAEGLLAPRSVRNERAVAPW